MAKVGRPMGKRHQDDVRSKIQVSQLLNVLQKQALDDEATEISATRMKAIELLLRKSLPDLSSIEIANKEGEDFRISRIERVIVRPKHSDS
jgi:hypothetical protein